jgi:hypothetical protein
MGLKDDLIKAKVECFKIMGKSEDEIDSSVGSALEVEANLMTEAIVNFLTNVEFKITQLKANVVLEDFSIPPQQADVLPTVQSIDIPYPAGTPAAAVPVPLNPSSLRNGVLTKTVDVNKDGGNTGILQSTGYVYIGEDPDSQDDFDVEDENGQREFTTVKLFRDDIEEFL